MSRRQAVPGRTQQQPMMSWEPVRGADGRVRMEMRWHVGAPAALRRAA